MLKKVNHYLSLFAIGALVLTIITALHAFTGRHLEREANTGSFETIDFSKGWDLNNNGEITRVDLPINIPKAEGRRLILTNKLPGSMHDGMTMAVHTNLEDVYVFINGELREKYCPSETGGFLYYHGPSAYVITEFKDSDSGADIEIQLVSKKKVAVLNEIKLAYGNGTWYDTLYRNARIILIAIVLMFLGICAVVAHFLLRRHIPGRKEIFYLALIMINIGVWITSEAGIRQLIFKRATLSAIFAYLSIEIVGVFVVKYLNEIQGHRYETMYTWLGLGIGLQFIVNIILALTHQVSFYNSLILSHMWMALGIILAIVNVFRDRRRDVVPHVITSVGMLIFLAMVVMELSYFYKETDHKFGAYVGVGLVILMLCNVVQVFLDEIDDWKKRSMQKSKDMLETIRTIAKTIDTKDSYTGGHSARVGQYAALLADRVRDIYEFSDEDIEKIRYIGQMHDIGKIGIPDSILNKPGRLTDEEFAMMKTHTTIGYDVLSELTFVEGLAEGVRSHHERYDGKGYPDGLAGENIPLVARILCIADSYDAMTTNRVYRSKLTNDEVLSELKRCSGTQFDPLLIEKFCELLEEKDQ